MEITRGKHDFWTPQPGQRDEGEGFRRGEDVMMGRLWGPSIPLSPTQHSAGEQGGISDSPPWHPELQAPEPFLLRWWAGTRAPQCRLPVCRVSLGRPGREDAAGWGLGGTGSPAARGVFFLL